MAKKLENYTGSVTLAAGITPIGDGDYPLVEAADVQVDNAGTRLDVKLRELQEKDSIKEIEPDADGECSVAVYELETGFYKLSQPAKVYYKPNELFKPLGDVILCINKCISDSSIYTYWNTLSLVSSGMIYYGTSIQDKSTGEISGTCTYVVYNTLLSTEKNASIRGEYTFKTAPLISDTATPESNDNSNKIPNTKWVQELVALAATSGNLIIDSANSIVETNNNEQLKLWVGTQEEYNNIETKQDNVFYLFTDDTSHDDLVNYIDEKTTENKNYIDNRTIDYVVEQGTAGSPRMNYRKWASGLIELWKETTVATFVSASKLTATYSLGDVVTSIECVLVSKTNSNDSRNYNAEATYYETSDGGQNVVINLYDQNESFHDDSIRHVYVEIKGRWK